MKHHGRQQEADALCSTINGPCQASGLSRQVEAQIQPEQMLVDTTCHFSNGFLCNASKDGIPELL
jgi:hypothetical protein